MPGGFKLAQADHDIVRFGVDEGRELVERRPVTVLREAAIDTEPQRLEIQDYFFDFLAAGFFAALSLAAASM